MVTVKLGELRGIVESLNEIMKEKLPVKTAYSFGKLARAVQKEIEVYEEGRLKLIDRYVKRGDDGKPVIINGNYDIGDKEGFGKEFYELGSIEAQFDFKPVSLDALGDISVSPVAINGLDRFIEGD
jgi:antitoxin component YwqK of YwqJK toxin-antitoxin module